jgi:hypothetical protein
MTLPDILQADGRLSLLAGDTSTLVIEAQATRSIAPAVAPQATSLLASTDIIPSIFRNYCLVSQEHYPILANNKLFNVIHVQLHGV